LIFRTRISVASCLTGSSPVYLRPGRSPRPRACRALRPDPR
jgi:hypothetical protein